MIRKLIVALSAIALMVGLAPAAHAQSGSVRIGDFTFDASLNAGESDLVPGGHVRLDLTATNTHGTGWWFGSNRVLNTYGFTVPDGFTLNGSGGPNMSSVGNHGQGGNYFGGNGGGVTSPVSEGSSRSGWLSFNIPADAQGGSVHSFGVKANLETLSSWFPTAENVIGFTLPAVGTETSVAAEPAVLQGGESTMLTADVAPVHGSNQVTAGEVEFLIDGDPIGRAPVENGGEATIGHTVEFLDDRTPVEHSVTARFLGDGNRFSASESAASTLTVEPEPKSEITSTVGLTATRGLVENGQLPITLDVNVDTSDGLDLPEGTEVEILRDGVVIDTVPVDGITATYTDHVDADVTEETTYSYTARLLETETDDTIYLPAESEPVEITIAPELAPEVTVSVDPAGVLVGGAVDIATTLTLDGEALPGGADVIIRANGRDIGTVTTDAEGNAVLDGHVFDSPGEKSIVAVFEGDEIDGVTYQPATSEPVTLTVDALPEVDSETVIELQTEATAGDEVSITAVISRLDGQDLTDEELTDLGSVWFFRDGEAVGSAPVVIDPETGEATAVFTHRFAERGEYRMTADYSGITAGEEVISPSETAEATVVTVSPSEIIIDEPGPPNGGGGGGGDTGSLGSLDLGSVTDLMGGEGAGSLSALSSGN